MNEDPKLQGKKVAVCGSTENRHGIVLTASYPAKRCGVKTGMANWEAVETCPDLIVVPPRYELYLKYSRVVRSVYRRYATDIEPFGMDENWLYLPQCNDPQTDGRAMAEEIRATVKRETGLTVSVGVSFSKIFAKLGSDLKKPDAVTVIGRSDFREKIWPLPVSELLYVGPATTRKLRRINVRTIGDLAMCDPRVLLGRLGRNGEMLHRFANGTDTSPVMPEGFAVPIKSVGHGVTCVRDLDNDYDVWCVLYALTQDIGHRLRDYELSVRGVQLTVRDRDLDFVQYQIPLSRPTRSPLEIADQAFRLFRNRYPWIKPVRALTVTGIKTECFSEVSQTDMFGAEERHLRRQTLDDAVDVIRRRFGDRSIVPASLMGELSMANDRCETVPMPAPMFRG
ncbi:MAG: DNA polymerase IV [Clostridiales bacterium]|nr:DNA polymerase IV [Clostridiales bacterium]